jgi:hypothetical protein
MPFIGCPRLPHSVLGAIDRIKAFAQVQKKRWHRGQRAVINGYRVIMI